MDTARWHYDTHVGRFSRRTDKGIIHKWEDEMATYVSELEAILHAVARQLRDKSFYSLHATFNSQGRPEFDLTPTPAYHNWLTHYELLVKPQ